MGSRVVYIPAMQNNQGSDERGKSLLIRSSDGHIFSIFYDHVVQENEGEADRVRMASKWEMSGRAVSETLHWLRERWRHLPGVAEERLDFIGVSSPRHRSLPEGEAHTRGSSRELLHAALGAPVTPERGSRLRGGWTSLEGALLSVLFCFFSWS